MADAKTVVKRRVDREKSREDMLKAEKKIRDRRYAEDLGNVFEGVQGKKAREGNYANTKLLNDAEAEYETKYGNLPSYKKGGAVKKMARGGGCEIRGKTKGKMV